MIRAAFEKSRGSWFWITSDVIAQVRAPGRACRQGVEMHARQTGILRDSSSIVVTVMSGRASTCARGLSVCLPARSPLRPFHPSRKGPSLHGPWRQPSVHSDFSTGSLFRVNAATSGIGAQRGPACPRAYGPRGMRYGSGGGQPTVMERVCGSLPYLIPLFDSLRYGACGTRGHWVLGWHAVALSLGGWRGVCWPGLVS